MTKLTDVTKLTTLTLITLLFHAVFFKYFLSLFFTLKFSTEFSCGSVGIYRISPLVHHGRFVCSFSPTSVLSFVSSFIVSCSLPLDLETP